MIASIKPAAAYSKLFAKHPFRNDLMKDPILCALMTRSISWGDLATEDVVSIIPSNKNRIIPSTTKYVSFEPKITSIQPSPYVTWEVPTVMHISRESPSFPLSKPLSHLSKPLSQLSKPQSSQSTIKTIIVNNIPRDVTKEDLIECFSEFGPIQGAHLPKNTDQSSPYYGTLRGFAMVQFVNAADAQNAQLMCMQNTFYVYNNPVNVQMAKEDRVIYTVKTK
jgi:RNA recognition motif-containing protein